MLLTPTLLALSICAVWLPPLTVSRQSVAPWLVCAVAAGIAGLISGSLTPIALSGVVLLGFAAWLATRTDASRRQRIAFISASLLLLLSLALALHRWPGFNNPLLIDAVRFSPGSLPFSLYANLDKGAAGLLLLALCCKRSGTWLELVEALRKTWWCMATGIALVMTTAVAMHLVHPDIKWPSQAWIFLPVNLLFSVVAEEAFFRGVVQEKMYRALRGGKWADAICVALSALLFGLAHVGGGVRYMALATLAGVVYAGVYHRSRRIEAAITAHFLLNAMHFIGFTYPALQ